MTFRTPIAEDLLIITNTYPFLSNYGGIFVEQQVETIRKNFKEVNVISPLSYFPSFLLNYNFFRNYSSYKISPKNYKNLGKKTFTLQFL